MKAVFEIDPDSTSDIDMLSIIVDAMKAAHDKNHDAGSEPTDIEYEEAWRNCSWEIVAFAIAILLINDGSTDKGFYAFFSSLLDQESQDICTIPNERAISSRVGRTVVICGKIGNLKLMEIAVRRKDQNKRVYIDPKAREVLLRLLHEDWNQTFDSYLIDTGKKPGYFQNILAQIS